MAIAQAMCTQFKVELLKGTHNFATNGNRRTTIYGRCVYQKYARCWISQRRKYGARYKKIYP